jgi:hypothetical protein
VRQHSGVADLVLFSTREAAAAWGVTARTVLRWVESGRAKPAKLSGGHVFTGEEVARVAQTPRPKRGGYRGRRPKPPPQAETLPDVS